MRNKKGETYVSPFVVLTGFKPMIFGPKPNVLSLHHRTS